MSWFIVVERVRRTWLVKKHNLQSKVNFEHLLANHKGRLKRAKDFEMVVDTMKLKKENDYKRRRLAVYKRWAF